MGCSGSVDQVVPLNEMANKNAIHNSYYPNGQSKNTAKITVCSVNIGEYTCPFEYFLKKNNKFQKKKMLVDSSSDQQADFDKSSQQNQSQRLQTQQRKLNKKYRKVAKYLYGKSLNVEVKYYEQKDYKKKISHILQINKLTTKKQKRYSPLYNKIVGFKMQQNQLNQKNKTKSKKNKKQAQSQQVIEGRSLMNTEQFIKKWDQVFDNLKKQNKQLGNYIEELKKTQQQYYITDLINQIRQFDLICYHTILCYIYNIKISNHKQKYLKQQTTLQQQDNHSQQYYKSIDYKKISQQHLNEIKNENLAYRYILFMRSKFQNPYFKLPEKINKLKNFIKKFNFDVVFVQEVSQDGLEDEIRDKLGYYLIAYQKNKSTIVLINQNLLHKLNLKQKNITLQGHNYTQVKNVQKQTNNISYIKKDSKIKTNTASTFGRFKDNLVPIQQQQFPTIDIDQEEAVTNTKIDLNSLVEQTVRLTGLSQIKSNKEQNSKINLVKNIITPQHNYFGEEAIVQFFGQLILISAFFKDVSSNKVMKKFQDGLQQYKKNFPQHTIIVGLNSSSVKKVNYDKTYDKMQIFRKRLNTNRSQSQQQDEKKLSKFYFIPDVYQAVPGIFDGQKCVVDGRKLKKLAYKKGLFTTFRKKTHFCLSYYDSCQEYMGVDSFILSTNKINQSIVRDCDGNKIDIDCDFYKQEQYLPSLKHPFTDFFICGEIDLQVQQIVQDEQQQTQELRLSYIEQKTDVLINLSQIIKQYYFPSIKQTSTKQVVIKSSPIKQTLQYMFKFLVIGLYVVKMRNYIKTIKEKKIEYLEISGPNENRNTIAVLTRYLTVFQAKLQKYHTQLKQGIAQKVQQLRPKVDDKIPQKKIIYSIYQLSQQLKQGNPITQQTYQQHYLNLLNFQTIKQTAKSIKIMKSEQLKIYAKMLLVGSLNSQLPDYEYVNRNYVQNKLSRIQNYTDNQLRGYISSLGGIQN